MLYSGTVIALHTGMRKLIIVILLLLPVGATPSNIDQESPSIEKAMELVNSKKPADALKILSAYRPTAADLARYHYSYAKACELSDRQLDSLAHFRLAYIYSQTNELKELTLIERSEAYLKMHYYPEAMISFRQFLGNFSNSSHVDKARLGLADSLYYQGLYSDALWNYEAAGGSLRAIYGKANTYQAMGRTDDAYQLYVSVIEKDREYLNSSQETLYRVAETFRLMGKSSHAKIYYDSLKDPLFRPKADIGLGLIALEASQFDAAFQHYNAALLTSNRELRRRALLHLALAYSKAGKQEETKSMLTQIRNKYPYSKEYETALLMLAHIYKKEGKSNEAVSLMKELASMRHLDKETLDEFEKIVLDAKNGDAAEFLKVWKSFGHLLLEPSRAKSLLDIADGLKSSGRPFVDLCAWLIKNGPSDVKGKCGLMLADFYADMGDASRASGYVKEIKGNNDDVLRTKARVYSANKEYQKAMGAIFALKEIEPKDIVFFADMIEYAKDVKRAVEFCERSLKNTGAPLKVYIKLADTLYKTGKAKDALKFYRIVAALKPENRKDLTQDDVGWTYYMVSKLSEGKSSLELPASVQQGTNIFSRSASVALKETDIRERMKRVF